MNSTHAPVPTDDDDVHEEEGSSMLGRATAPRRQPRRSRSNGRDDDDNDSSESFLNGSLSVKLVLLLLGAVVVVWYLDHSSSTSQMRNLYSANLAFNSQQDTILNEKKLMKEQIDKQLSTINELTKQVANKQKASTEAELALAQARESLHSLNSSSAEERAALAQKLADAEAAARAASTPSTSTPSSPSADAPDSNVWVAHRRLRVLVLYAYFKSGNSEPNLAYFLKAGVLPYANDSHVQFVLATSSSLDGMSLPAVPNFAVLQRPNAGMDFCGWRQAIEHLKDLTDGRVSSIYQYDRVILINGSIRGPFMPALAGDRWIDLFVSPLDHCGATPPPNSDGTPGQYTGTCEIGLVGTSINCHKIANPSDRFLALHAQSMLLAFPTIYWKELENNIQCWSDTGHVFVQGEVGLTWAALKHGHNIAVTSQLWRDWQFKDLDATSKRCRWIAEKSWHQWGDNHCVRCMPEDVTPVGMDLLFIKTNRDIDPGRLRLETKLGFDHFNIAYPNVKYSTPNGGIPSVIKFVDISNLPVNYGPPDTDFISHIVNCLGRAGAEGVTTCDQMPPEPPVLLEWMQKNKKQ